MGSLEIHTIIIFLQIQFPFQKSIKHILPQNDDCRSLQICLQAASMNLQLSQIPNSNGAFSRDFCSFQNFQKKMPRFKILCHST